MWYLRIMWLRVVALHGADMEIQHFCWEECYEEEAQDPIVGHIYRDTVSSIDWTGTRKQLIYSLIVKAICEADRKGTKVASLGLLSRVYISPGVQTILHHQFSWSWFAQKGNLTQQAEIETAKEFGLLQFCTGSATPLLELDGQVAIPWSKSYADIDDTISLVEQC